MIDVGKLIGGPDEGDGIVGGLLGIFALGGAGAAAGAGSGLFDGIGGASMADGVGAAVWDATASGAGESIFTTIFRNWTFTDWYFMYDAAHGSFSHTAKQAWSALSEHAKEVVSAHGFIRQQLRIHGNEALADEYEQLGASLPSKDLLSRAYRELATKLHPDQNTLDEELIKALNAARDSLNNTAKVGEYQRAVRFNIGAVEEFLHNFDKTNAEWKKKYEQASRTDFAAEGRLLEDAAGEARAGARAGKTFKQAISELSGAHKVGLVVAGAAIVGVGVFIGAKLAARHKEKKALKSRRIHPRGTPAAGGVGLDTGPHPPTPENHESIEVTGVDHDQS